jgi:hypothetical protein
LHNELNNNKEQDISLTQDENRALPYIELSARAQEEEDELFREDAEEKRKENDAELRPKAPTTYMNMQG